MNWKYTKSFLILLIVLVDILLVRFCYDYYMAREFTARETAEDAVAVLQAGDIEVSADLLAVRADSAPTRRCAYTREDYARLVFGILCGKDADGFFLLPDGIRAVTADGDAARLGYDFSLEFVAAGRDAAVIEAAYAKGYTATADTEAVRRALETLLGLPEGAAKSFPATTADGYVFFTRTAAADGIPLSLDDCVFAFLGTELVYARGSYLFLSTEAEDAEPLLTRINILLSERRRGAAGTVRAISLCYAPYEDAAEGTLWLLPAYRVTYADGSVSVVNAQSGEKY